jgi:hypothetical protein
MSRIVFRAATLLEALLQPAFDENGGSRKEWVRPQSVLQAVIRQTYEGEKPEKEAIPRASLGNGDFYRDLLWPLYLDSLLLRREDVRTFCRENQIPQLSEMKGLLFENRDTHATTPTPAQPSAAPPLQGSTAPVIDASMSGSVAKKPEMPNRIAVKKAVASIKSGKNHDQLRNTLNENAEAHNTVKQLKSTGLNIADILPLMDGGQKVKACLLYDDRPTPEAAYRALLAEFPTSKK